MATEKFSPSKEVGQPIFFVFLFTSSTTHSELDSISLWAEEIGRAYAECLRETQHGFCNYNDDC